MTEQALRFGPEKKLIGILNCPERFEKDFPTALILNAGIVHRVGPFRIHVDLARALANQYRKPSFRSIGAWRQRGSQGSSHRNESC